MDFDRLRDKLISWNMKTKTVKVYGPWVNGNQAGREISLEVWNSYTPLNRSAMEGAKHGLDQPSS